MMFSLLIEMGNHMSSSDLADAMVLKYSKASDVWIGSESSVYIGKLMGVQGKQRRAIEVQYLHQEQLLSRCNSIRFIINNHATRIQTFLRGVIFIFPC